MTPEVYAAGALCWRVVDGTIRVLVVHRPGHRDVSLPKGKVDPGETLPQTAVREVREETGLSLALGVPLGISRYQIAGDRTKVVHYWAAEASDEALRATTFRPNDEVSKVSWASLSKVRKRLTYPYDVEIVDAFERVVSGGVLSTFALIPLRHAKATGRGDWRKADTLRPLTRIGTSQAAAVAPTLLAWHPERVLTSPAVRCRQTVEPLTKAMKRKAKTVEGLSQDAWDAGTGTVRETVDEQVRAGRTTVLCSHGPVLPEILADITEATGSEPAAAGREIADLKVGGFWVVHLSRSRTAGRIVSIETHVPAI